MHISTFTKTFGLSLIFCTLAMAQQPAKSTDLIPSSVVTNLLKTYSEEEKVLISDDLENIKKTCFRGKLVATDANPVYVGTAGGPGACKSTILENYLQNKPGFVYADPDQRSLKFMINTYYQSVSNYQKSKQVNYNDLLCNAYNKWRDASNYIANTILNEAYAKGHNIAHGTTATSSAVSFLYQNLKQKNYKIVLLLCYASDDTRVKSLDHRAKVQGFYQNDAEDTVNKGKMFPDRFPTYFEYADEIHLYWTEDFLKGSTHAATYEKEKGLVTHDKNALDLFIKKYDADRKDKQLPSFDALTKRS